MDSRVVLLGSVLLFVACRRDGPNDPPARAPTRIAVLWDGEGPLHMGDTVRVRAYRLDSEGLPIVPDTVSFAWTTTDPSVLTVDDTGLVAIVGLGSAEVVARLRGTGVVPTPSPRDTATGRLEMKGTYTVIDPGPVLTATFGELYECIVRVGGQAYCRGLNLYGTLGDGTNTDRSDWSPVAGGLVFESIVAGRAHTCGLTQDHRAYCWGRGHHGQLGNGIRSLVSTNVPIPAAPALRFTMIDAGGHGATCGISVADSIPYCFGHNDYGQVGREPLSDHDTVVAPVSGSHRMRAVYTRDWTMCGLETDGSAHCAGHYGPGTNTIYPTGPVQPASGALTKIGGTAVLTRISIGDENSCGLTATGVAYCWGYNFNGELGTGDYIDSGSLRAVTGVPPFSSIHAFHYGACGITLEGDAWCWGTNEQKELGRATPDPMRSATPVRVRLDVKLRWIQSGDIPTACVHAITESNQLICWGNGY